MGSTRSSLGKFIPVLLILQPYSDGFRINSHRFQTTETLNRPRPSSAIRQGRVPNTSLFSTNPFSSMIGDFASSIMSRGDSVKPNPSLDATLSKLVSSSAGSWEAIRSRLEALQTPEERKFRDNLSKGYGIGSPMHKVRLYDENNKEEDIRVTFYRDSASWW